VTRLDTQLHGGKWTTQLQFLHNKRADAFFKYLTKRTMALVAVNVSHKKDNAITMPVSILPYSTVTRKADFCICDIRTQPNFNKANGIWLVSCHKCM